MLLPETTRIHAVSSLLADIDRIASELSGK